MRYFLDTEFTEKQGSLQLLTIGIVAEDGREFYGIDDKMVDYAQMAASDFVKAEVLPYIMAPMGILPLKGSTQEIGKAVRGFIGQDQKPEFWGYYADYDWVLFCWLFGRMIDLPKGWPQYCRDLKQLCDSMANPRLPVQPKKHHALSDARWIAAAYRALTGGGGDGR